MMSSNVRAQLDTVQFDTACGNSVISLSFADAPLPATDVELIFWASGDLSGSNENFDIKSENGSFIGNFTKGSDCGAYDSTVFNVPRDSFADWCSDGVVSFSNHTSSAVNICSPYMCIYLQAVYDPIIVPNDAGVTSINRGPRSCAGSQNISVDVTNFGDNQINSLLVNWSVNGVSQTAASMSGSLDTVGGTGGNSLQVNLGSFNFTAGNSYSFKIWTSQPNGAADTINFNDTLNHSMVVAMDGSYTIGGTSPDYNDISSAVADLQRQGVCGPVNFSVRDGNYSEQVLINQIPGASAANNISFQGASADSSLVNLNYSSSSSGSNYVLRLDGADYVSFKNLSVEATNNSYARAVEIINDCHSLSFSNCAFLGLSSTSSSTYRNLVEMSNLSGSHYIFRNNYFENGSSALDADASSASHMEVVNNEFRNSYYRGIYIRDINHLKLDSNLLHTNSTYDNYRGLELYNCDSSLFRAKQSA
ncbi:MAG: hypothetical protein U5L96_21410 [Owenweeksia sp.]|nr:hypothetical protein [Owenweeksia sp.]